MRWNQWVIFGLGIWLFVSPWILGYAGLNLVLWNSLMVGALTIIFALWDFKPPEI